MDARGSALRQQSAIAVVAELYFETSGELTTQSIRRNYSPVTDSIQSTKRSISDCATNSLAYCYVSVLGEHKCNERESFECETRASISNERHSSQLAYQ